MSRLRADFLQLSKAKVFDREDARVKLMSRLGIYDRATQNQILDGMESEHNRQAFMAAIAQKELNWLTINPWGRG